MKQFIVLIATLPIILGLLMQIGLAQQNFIKLMRVEQIVGDYRAVAAQSGGFSYSMGSDMRHELSAASGVAESSIVMYLDPQKDSGGGSISYRIEIPGFKLVAANRLFGIKDSDNNSAYIIEGTVQSML